MPKTIYEHGTVRKNAQGKAPHLVLRDHHPAVQDPRGNAVPRPRPIVPVKRRRHSERLKTPVCGVSANALVDEDDRGEGPSRLSHDDEYINTEDEAEAKRHSVQRRCKRTRLSQLEELAESVRTCSPPIADSLLPSSDLLQCIHHFASEHYTSRGMLLNSSKDYRAQKKARRARRLSERARTSSSSDEDTFHDNDESHDEHSLRKDEIEEGEDAKKSKGKGKKRDTRRLGYRTDVMRDMYKVMDGSALVAIGMLLEEHVAFLVSKARGGSFYVEDEEAEADATTRETEGDNYDETVPSDDSNKEELGWEEADSEHEIENELEELDNADRDGIGEDGEEVDSGGSDDDRNGSNSDEEEKAATNGHQDGSSDDEDNMDER
ncbi:hypothetical protein FISHEDRAFT_68473 [Fistulina hepatica ATCC 64428]|uniref:Uncharacterized protein n=1 Tax=Fistulina hepatica ATCC 64428 TaxID=1128425 RepID=A0A0D7ARF0_9AGAR|nr:hypothetical protein FISHEDRAFT_68473 [Fistulina hepatica ATCC 64428]